MTWPTDGRVTKWGSQQIGNDKSRPIKAAECKDGMSKQIKCEFGGTTSYGNWKYRWINNSVDDME
jgi:hypothetical protein